MHLLTLFFFLWGACAIAPLSAAPPADPVVQSALSLLQAAPDLPPEKRLIVLRPAVATLLLAKFGRLLPPQSSDADIEAWAGLLLGPDTALLARTAERLPPADEVVFDGSQLAGGGFSRADALIGLHGRPVAMDRQVPVQLVALDQAGATRLKQEALLSSQNPEAHLALRRTEALLQAPLAPAFVADGLFMRPYNGRMDDLYYRLVQDGGGVPGQMTFQAVAEALPNRRYHPLTGVVSPDQAPLPWFSLSDLLSGGGLLAVEDFKGRQPRAPAGNPFAGFAARVLPNLTAEDRRLSPGQKWKIPRATIQRSLRENRRFTPAPVEPMFADPSRFFGWRDALHGWQEVNRRLTRSELADAIRMIDLESPLPEIPSEPDASIVVVDPSMWTEETLFTDVPDLVDLDNQDFFQSDEVFPLIEGEAIAAGPADPSIRGPVGPDVIHPASPSAAPPNATPKAPPNATPIPMATPAPTPPPALPRAVPLVASLPLVRSIEALPPSQTPAPEPTPEPTLIAQAPTPEPTPEATPEPIRLPTPVPTPTVQPAPVLLAGETPGLDLLSTPAFATLPLTPVVTEEFLSLRTPEEGPDDGSLFASLAAPPPTPRMDATPIPLTSLPPPEAGPASLPLDDSLALLPEVTAPPPPIALEELLPEPATGLAVEGSLPSPINPVELGRALTEITPSDEPLQLTLADPTLPDPGLPAPAENLVALLGPTPAPSPEPAASPEESTEPIVIAAASPVPTPTPAAAPTPVVLPPVELPPGRYVAAVSPPIEAIEAYVTGLAANDAALSTNAARLARADSYLVWLDRATDPFEQFLEIPGRVVGHRRRDMEAAIEQATDTLQALLDLRTELLAQRQGLLQERENLRQSTVEAGLRNNLLRLDQLLPGNRGAHSTQPPQKKEGRFSTWREVDFGIYQSYGSSAPGPACLRAFCGGLPHLWTVART